MNEDIKKYIGEESPGYCFEVLPGRDFWKTILASYWNEETMDDALEIDPVQLLLLCGPYGCGKSALLGAMAGEMVQGGYQYLEVDLMMIPKDKILSVFQFLCKEYKKDGPIYFHINHLECLHDVRLLLKTHHWAEEREYPMIIAASVEDEGELPSDIRKLFHIHYIGLPDSEDRKAYFKYELESLFDNSSIQGMSKLVDGTEGYNYVQMGSLVQRIKMRVKYSMLKEGKSMDIAMAWLQEELVQEVLEHSDVPKKNSSESMDVTALVQAMAMIQPVHQAQQTESVKSQEKDPLTELREKYNPRKVFDQGLMFVKE